MRRIVILLVFALVLVRAGYVKGASFQILDHPPDLTASMVSRLSSSGNYAAGFSSSPQSHEAFRWMDPWSEREGRDYLLTAPGTTRTSPQAVANDGSVVGIGSGQAVGRQIAVRWTPTTGVLPIVAASNGNSGAMDVTADGAIAVGFYLHDSNSGAAFKWTADSGAVSLNPVPSPGT